MVYIYAYQMTTMDETPAQQAEDSFLKSLPHEVVLRAKYIVSHLLLPEGATVLDLQCDTGALTAAMAYLNPRLNFIGLDRNRQLIMRARARFKTAQLDNLGFEVGDALNLRRADDSVDAIVASNLLGDIYSRGNYDETRIADMMGRLFKLLKADGLMVIHDYAMPEADEYVQIEFPVPIRDPRHFRLYGTPIGKTQGEREIELLQWFSENASARDAVKGFYLEELPPHVPYTRCFRLPAKWAYEFIIRKQNIRKFKANIGHQHTCLTEADYDRVLGRNIGARILLTAPQRQPHITRSHYDGAFRLYTAEGKARGYMPTGHIVVAQKIQQGRPLRLEELRPSSHAAQSISIQTVRDEKNGEVADVVSRVTPRVEIIPYFMATNGSLKVILQAEAEKGIANLTPRTRNNLDGKRWSGHMVCAPSLPVYELEGFDHASLGAIARLMIQKFGLTPQHGKGFEDGLKGYPSPAMIDERMDTIYINVQPPMALGPRATSPFDELRLKVYDAEDVLRATGAGFIPNAWLDIQLQDLMKRNGLKPKPWLHEAVPLSYDPPPEDQMLRAAKILKQKPKKPEKPSASKWAPPEKWPVRAGSFKPIRGHAGQVTAHRSSFVERGQKDGVVRGLAAHDLEFANPQADMQNIAAIMPLTEDFQGNTLVGFEYKELPVPSRFGQEGPMMNLPTLPLPASVTNIDEARAYIAEQFDVELARVAPMGESFFTMVDLMPQRVYPFMLTRYPRRRNLSMKFRNLYDILDLTDTDFADSFLWKWGLAHAYLCQETAHQSNWAPRAEAHQRVFGKNAAKWESASASWYKTRSANDKKRMASNAPRRRHE
ncbi:MAG: methyltransferase domain-containing protein [Alphaproteobacteria bacterium]|nr:methyltransferase domain-containing protein [Alphaproteobacteria bacterium]